ncbi:MAG TPA: hypothetical protein VF667_09035 [Pseudonocardia sp.]|jgi:hypothetical protein
MATFVFIWDPTNASYPAGQYAAHVAVTAAGGVVEGRWSTGSRRRGLQGGDRAFLLRTRRERGIVAAGHLVDGEVFLDRHYADPSRLKAYTRIAWERLVPADDRLPVEELLRDVPGHAWNAVYGSGQQVRPPADDVLEEVWNRHLDRLRPVRRP